MTKEETIWEEMYRFIGSIQDEIRADDTDMTSIDFWCFKLKRRVKILEDAFNKTNNGKEEIENIG